MSGEREREGVCVYVWGAGDLVRNCEFVLVFVGIAVILRFRYNGIAVIAVIE